MPKSNQYWNNSGQMFILTLIALALITVGTLAILAGSFTFKQNSRYSLEALEAINLAEAGADKAIGSLNRLGGSYTGEAETQLGPGTYEVSVTSIDSGNKLIESTGYVPNKANAKLKRKVKIKSSTGIGASFIYGIQVGEGGLQLGNNNEVTGSIYSNGNITMGNNNLITGDAWVAGGPQPTPDQQTDCTDPNCQDYLFGKNISGENRLDVAQSFKLSSEAELNKITLKLKKIGSPPDLTVRILKDINGNPDKSQVVTSGTLVSNLVTSAYGFIDITFNSTPELENDQKYWIVLDTSSNSSNYWSWQNDTLGSYTGGAPKYSPNWQAGNPVWTNINGDLSFKVYTGGVATLISAGNNSQANGDVHANTINNLTIGRDAYYQIISGSTVQGTSFPGSADPPPKVFPLSDANIAQWKQQAEDGGIASGDINNCVSTLGPTKIDGNVTLDSNCTVTIRGPVWITGNLTLNNQNLLRLDPSFGTTSGVIVVDGQIQLGNNNQLQGTGQGSSLLMALSNYDSRTNGIAAIRVNNTGNSGVFYTSTGIIEPGNNNSFKELTAWGIRLTNDSTINYETGLSSTLFSSGPSGSFTLVKGTYQIE